MIWKIGDQIYHIRKTDQINGSQKFGGTNLYFSLLDLWIWAVAGSIGLY